MMNYKENNMEEDKKHKYINIVIILLIMTIFWIIFNVLSVERNTENNNISEQKTESEVHVYNSKVVEEKIKIDDTEQIPISKTAQDPQINTVPPSYDNNINSISDNNIISSLNSNNINIKKRIFYDMLEVYQKAFCTDSEKNAKLPEDLFETLALSLPKSGSSDISTEEFIRLNYSDINAQQKSALQQILNSLKEVSGIRLWDISKSLISYGILKSNNINLTKENLKKAQSCINGKWDFSDIEADFYNSFGISQSNTHKILTSLCESDWINAQTSFGIKFLSINQIVNERKIPLQKTQNNAATNLNNKEVNDLEQEIENLKKQREEQELRLKKLKLEEEIKKLKQQEELKKPEIESEFKYPKNVDNSIILANKGEKLHVVSVHGANNTIRCSEGEDCFEKGMITINVTDNTEPVNLFLSSYNPVFWDIRAAKDVKINKIYVGSHEKSRVKAPKETRIYSLSNAGYFGNISQYHKLENELKKQVLTFQYKQGEAEFTIDGINGKIMR